MFRGVLRRISISLFIAVGASSSASAQETDRATLIVRAKKEGEVVWYTSAGLQDSKPMADAFQKDYPFIQVSILRAGSGVLINKILNEARAQKGLFDVLNTKDPSLTLRVTTMDGDAPGLGGLQLQLSAGSNLDFANDAS